jgi:hypothetical protein
VTWYPNYPDVSDFIAAEREEQRVLRERRAQRCTDCFFWVPFRWSKCRATWGECRKNSFATKWTFGICCLDFRKRPSRAFLRLVKK